MGLAPTNYTDHNVSAAVHLLVVLYACHWTNIPVTSGGFRGVSEVSTEPPFGLHLDVRSTDNI